MPDEASSQGWAECALDILARNSGWTRTLEVLAFDVRQPNPWHDDLISLCEQRLQDGDGDRRELLNALVRLRRSAIIEVPTWKEEFRRWLLRLFLRDRLAEVQYEESRRESSAA